MTFCSLESRSPIKNVIKRHVQVFFKENDTHKKFQIFVETYGLTPLEKWTLSHSVKMIFIAVKKAFFLLRTSSNIMSSSFSKKKRLRRNFKFLLKIMS